MKELINGFISAFILWVGGFIWQSEFWTTLSLTQQRLLIGFILILLIISIFFLLKKYFDRRKYHYDIFISYRTSQRQWVEALAKNLQQQGYTIFLDIWEIQAGQDSSEIIDKAIQSSRVVLLITTPDASESGWIQTEYESMLKQQQQDSKFRCIPIILGEFPDSPFLEKVQAIDFKDSRRDNYAIAFQCLISALKNQPPGSKPYFKGVLEIPPAYILEEKEEENDVLPQELDFVEEIFKSLDINNAVMVLHQIDSTSQHYSTALLTKAVQYFGEQQCLHLFPPASPDANNAAYFSRLSIQCGFEPQEESWQWADALKQRLQQYSKPLFIIITGFENGSDAARKELASELRDVLDHFSSQLKLVIFGAEKLAAMKYQNGTLSLLNLLEEKRLPELEIQDLQQLFNQRYAHLKSSQLNELFAFTGQNPRLIQACLQNRAYSTEECEQYLSNSSLPSQLFSRFQQDNPSQLCHYLQQQEICNYSVWPQEKLVRKLYWNNLIKRSHNKFIWRSEYIQKIGKQILECNKK